MKGNRFFFFEISISHFVVLWILSNFFLWHVCQVLYNKSLIDFVSTRKHVSKYPQPNKEDLVRRWHLFFFINFWYDVTNLPQSFYGTKRTLSVEPHFLSSSLFFIFNFLQQFCIFYREVIIFFWSWRFSKFMKFSSDSHNSLQRSWLASFSI